MKHSAISIARKAAAVLDEKKAEAITVLKMPQSATMFNYFVIANALSRTHAQTLAQNLSRELKKQKII